MRREFGFTGFGFGARRAASTSAAPPPPPINLYPDPSLDQSGDYDPGVSDSAVIAGGIRFTGSNSNGFDRVTVGGATATSFNAAVEGIPSCMCRFFVANFVQDNGIKFSIRGAASVSINAAGNGWTTPVEIPVGLDPGEGFGPTEWAELDTGGSQFDILDVEIVEV